MAEPLGGLLEQKRVRIGGLKQQHLLVAILLGMAIVVVGYTFERYLPSSVSDTIFFPGLAVGSVLFGHSAAMVFAGMVVNLLFYSFLSLGIIRLFTRKT